MKKELMKKALVSTLVLTLLAGCGSKGATTTNGTTAKPAGETSKQTGQKTEEKAKGQEKKSGLYVGEGDYFPLKSQKTVKIAGVRDDAGKSFAEVTYFKDLEKATNVKVEWLDWPQQVQKERRSLAFASGELPDAFYGGWSFDKPDVVKYGSEGFLLDMNKYLNDDVMPNVNKLMKNIDGLKKSLQVPTGEVYVLSTLDQNGLPTTNDTLLINQEWLKKVNKPMPKTTDELVDVLKAFKAAGDLNGNGQADEIPFSFRYNDGNNGAFGLMGFTGIPAQSKGSRMVMKDGKPVFYPILDEYKEYLTFLNKLQNEGVLDKEVFTMDLPTYNAKTQSATPTVGLISSWSAEGVNRPIKGFDTTKDGPYVYLPPLKGPKGIEPKWGMRTNPLNGNLTFAISADTKDPELLARWIDIAYEPETSIHNYVGVEGKHMKKEADGTYTHIKNDKGKNFSKTEMYGDIPAKFASAWVLEDSVKWKDQVVSVQDKIAADAVYGKYLEKNIVQESIMTTAEENEKLSTLTTDLLSYVDQSTAKFVTHGGIEEGWAAYIEQLKKLGLDDYVKIKTQIHERATQK